MESFQRARRAARIRPVKPLAVRTLDEQQAELPDWRLDHLLRMTDSTGMFQHASLHDPQFRRGILHRRQRPGLAPDRAPGGARPGRAGGPAAGDDLRGVPPRGLRPRTASRFRNFLGFDRRWLEEVGSDDCHGRALWALGACVGRSKRPDLPSWAAQIFEPALPPVTETHLAPRLGLRPAGIHEYFRRLSGDRLAGQVRDTLDRPADRALRADRDRRLAVVRGSPQLRQRQAAARPDRQRPMERQRQGAGGRPALAPLAGRSSRRAPQGHFRPIGCNGFYRKGGSSRPSSTSSRSRPTPRSRPASRPTAPPRTRLARRGPLGLRLVPRPQRPGPASSTTRAPAAAATACSRTASTRTRGPNRRSPSCSRWPR